MGTKTSRRRYRDSPSFPVQGFLQSSVSRNKDLVTSQIARSCSNTVHYHGIRCLTREVFSIAVVSVVVSRLPRQMSERGLSRCFLGVYRGPVSQIHNSASGAFPFSTSFSFSCGTSTESIRSYTFTQLLHSTYILLS